MSVYQSGQSIGEYELREQIGRGGMGEVWLARAEDGTPVAVKVMFPRPDRRKEALERFEREAAAAARIGHAAIVRIHECGIDEAAGSMFLVMELLEGAHLRAWLGQRKRTALEALRVVRELLSPLAAAHACRENDRAAPIIHRDLKPENVFVLEPPVDGVRVKLLDFGIARQEGSTVVTDTGVGMGTAAYMSPEQATDAREVGPPADVWSVGVMLYEILAGRAPFDAPSRNEILSKVLTIEPLPLREIAPGLPKSLARVVASCLAKEPERRPRDAAALARELDAILRDERDVLGEMELGEAARTASASTLRGASTTRDPEGRRGGAFYWISGTIALIAAGALAIGWLTTPRDRPRPTIFAQPVRDAGVDAGVETNRWIAIAAGDVRLGVDDEQLDVKKTGFRPSANVRAPSRPYSIQQHEVTWEELEGWLGNRTLPILSSPPAWLPSERSARARLPATGVPWRIAHDYCVAMGASLPTEEQWEHAARGAERRPYAWGDAQPDPDRSNVGPGEHPVAVMTRDQDRTPGRREDAVWDLMGNAREWTLDLWRNANGRPENIAEGLTFRTVRGLPLVTSSGNFRPPERAPAAHRTRLCASGLCPAGTDAVLVDVGFRCVRE